MELVKLINVVYPAILGSILGLLGMWAVVFLGLGMSWGAFTLGFVSVFFGSWILDATKN